MRAGLCGCQVRTRALQEPSGDRGRQGHCYMPDWVRVVSDRHLFGCWAQSMHIRELEAGRAQNALLAEHFAVNLFFSSPKGPPTSLQYLNHPGDLLNVHVRDCIRGCREVVPGPGKSEGSNPQHVTPLAEGDCATIAEEEMLGPAGGRCPSFQPGADGRQSWLRILDAVPRRRLCFAGQSQHESQHPRPSASKASEPVHLKQPLYRCGRGSYNMCIATFSIQFSSCSSLCPGNSLPRGKTFRLSTPTTRAPRNNRSLLALRLAAAQRPLMATAAVAEPCPATARFARLYLGLSEAARVQAAGLGQRKCQGRGLEA